MPVPVDETEEPAVDQDETATELPVPDEQPDGHLDQDPDEDLDREILMAEVEDRWRWRRHLRADPRRRAIYRFFVGLAGGLFIVAGLVTGPLPGPGGIPLVLLGLAIWASEFHWAHRLMMRFQDLLHRFRQWSRPRQVLFWVIFFACCGLLGWLYLVVLGVPGWMPAAAVGWLQRLPGV